MERSKIKTIMKEQSLRESGFYGVEKAVDLGKLISADLILTGTFAKKGSIWDVNLRVVIHDKNHDNNIMNRFIASFDAEQHWKRVKIPFTNFTLAKKFAKRNPGGDGVLDLEMINSFAIVFRGKENDRAEQNVWLDEIRLYR